MGNDHPLHTIPEPLIDRSTLTCNPDRCLGNLSQRNSLPEGQKLLIILLCFRFYIFRHLQTISPIFNINCLFSCWLLPFRENRAHFGTVAIDTARSRTICNQAIEQEGNQDDGNQVILGHIGERVASEIGRVQYNISRYAEYEAVETRELTSWCAYRLLYAVMWLPLLYMKLSTLIMEGSEPSNEQKIHSL
ncbi:hypothetical protein AKJ16_DCAP01176 [Drosera capensis]